MAGKGVAKEGDVKASSTGTTYANATGTWTPGTINETTYSKLTTGGGAVVHKAECTFSFSGADNSSGATVTGTSDVTLSAGTTLLQKGASNVLVDGDSESDSYGNELRVSAQNPLQSS